MRKHVCLCNCITSNDSINRSGRFEAFSKTAYSKEIKMCLEDNYKKGKVRHLLITEAAQATGLYSILCIVWCYQRGMQEQDKVRHLLITEAAQATGLYSILCMILLVWCYFRPMAEWCNVHIAKNGNIYPIFKHFTNATIVMITPQ